MGDDLVAKDGIKVIIIQTYSFSKLSLHGSYLAMPLSASQ